MTDSNKPVNKKKRRVTFSRFGFFLISLLNLALFSILGWKAGLGSLIFPAQIVAVTTAVEATTPQNTAIPSQSVQPTLTDETPSAPILIQTNPSGDLPGMIYLSLSEAGYFHIFAYNPESQPLLRLTFGDWDDREPAVSPDGKIVAFSSNRSGYWDIYTLDVSTGITTQVTDDNDYNGHPAWSPDGQWLAYEKYTGNNLDIYINPINTQTGEIRVTTNPASDFEPAWQPGSRILAFTSTRTGAQDIFIIDTENLNDDEAQQNYTFNGTQDQAHATWSPDGITLAWSAQNNGYANVFSSLFPDNAEYAIQLTAGDALSWDPSGGYLLTSHQTPDQSYLTIQFAESLSYLIPATYLDGQLAGFTWGENALPATLPPSIAQAAVQSPQEPWMQDLVSSAGALYGRPVIIDLPDINAPHPALSALAVEPFYALKDRALRELDWDVLSDLENMFVSLTEPLPPGRASDWLYTGRAFALNPVLIDYDYMLVIREEFGTQTYWRIFLKPLQQDGSQGQPITNFPWDFETRFTGTTTAYEEGGSQYTTIPEGYWVDFTSLAIEYGWERQPALNNWRSYYQGARFNTFAITSGLDWEDAMLQLWPADAFQE